MDSKIPDWGREMHEALDRIADKYCLSSKNFTTFLVAALIEEFITQDATEEEATITLNTIFEKYLKLKNIIEERKGN